MYCAGNAASASGGDNEDSGEQEEQVDNGQLELTPASGISSLGRRLQDETAESGKWVPVHYNMGLLITFPNRN